MPKSIESLTQRFIFFGRNSSIHGLNHLFRNNANFLARLFWLTIMVISTGCLYLLLVPYISLNDGINFTPDTLYLNWTTTFPAVTVCDMYSASSDVKKLKDLYPHLLDPLSYDQRRYLIDLLRGRGKCSPTRCVPCGTLVACDVPWRKMMDDVHKKCEQLLTNCSYMGEEFSCCKLFHMVDSEYGPCYSFNTMQNAGFLEKPLLKANRKIGPGLLKFRLESNSIISIHSSEELSTNNLGAEYFFFFYVHDYQETEILFSVVEMDNDPMVNHINIQKRVCRFPHEIPEELFHTYPHYHKVFVSLTNWMSIDEIEAFPKGSTLIDGPCRYTHMVLANWPEARSMRLNIAAAYLRYGIYLRKNDEKFSRRAKLYRTTPFHLVDAITAVSLIGESRKVDISISLKNVDEKYYCNYTGLNCLAEHEARKKLGLKKANDHEAECLPSCVESELFIVHDKRTTPSSPEGRGKSNLVTIKMSSLPTLRYQRNVLRTNLDFVVSVGGMVGLFFSASLLSAIELIYLMLRTPIQTKTI